MNQGDIQSNETGKCIVNLKVPFESNRLASIAKNSIDADEVPNPELITRTIKFKRQLKDLIMVFISFPADTTSEEETLMKKYEKLDKKRKHLEKAAKPEPEVVAKTSNKPMEARDAQKVIEKLKKTGQLNKIIINPNKKTEFKRKVPQINSQSATKSTKPNTDPDVAREAVNYDDDLFS